MPGMCMVGGARRTPPAACLPKTVAFCALLCSPVSLTCACTPVVALSRSLDFLDSPGRAHVFMTCAENFGKFYGYTRTRGHVRSRQHGRRMGPVLVCCCPPPSRDARERARPARPADCRRATTSDTAVAQVALSLPQFNTSGPAAPARRHRRLRPDAHIAAVIAPMVTHFAKKQQTDEHSRFTASQGSTVTRAQRHYTREALSST